MYYTDAAKHVLATDTGSRLSIVIVIVTCLMYETREEWLPFKQPANLIAASSIVLRASCIERVLDLELSLPACQKAATRNAMWVLDRLLELPRVLRAEQQVLVVFSEIHRS